MKKINFQFVMLMMLSLALTFTSCRKDEDPAGDTSASSDDAYAESIYDNVSNIGDEAYAVSSNTLKSVEITRNYLSDCVEISLDTVSIPHALIIDFGEENCLCNDGKYRRGIIIVSFTGHFWRPGTVLTYEFDNYHVNDNRVEGTKVITNMGFNDEDNMYYSFEVIGVIYLANNGGTISWNSSMEVEWIEGIDTFILRDDVYLISGEADGIRANGYTWEREIINPLRKEIGCKHFVSGTVEMRPEGLAIRLLDYGNGECDNIATVIIDGVVYTIMLP